MHTNYRSKIENALWAINLATNSKLTLRSTIFNRNGECIYVHGTPTILGFSDNIFSGEYVNKSVDFNYGIELYGNVNGSSNWDIENIASGTNQFIGLTKGINGYNSNIKIQNCQFLDCETGIQNVECHGKSNHIKGFGKASSTATFLNNNSFNIYIEGDGDTKITDCLFYIDNRFNSSHLIPAVNLIKNNYNGGSILIDKNSFIDHLYNSTFADPGVQNVDLWIYRSNCPGGSKITHNTFTATNHSDITKQLIVQCFIDWCHFDTRTDTISNDTFELNHIYCIELGDADNIEGSFYGCLECNQSRSLFIDENTTNVLVSNNKFNKDASGATSTEINGGSWNINVEANGYSESNRMNRCDNVGIRVVGSIAYICSNAFFQNYVGLDALYGSAGTEVTANYFDGNYAAIHYFGTTVLGPQSHRGNIWANEFESGFILIHDFDQNGPNNDQINQYLIDKHNYGSTSQHFWPETYTSDNFVRDQYDNLNACMALPIEPFGPNLFNDLPRGQKWESYYQIIRSIKEGGEFTISTYESLYDSLYNLPIYQLMLVENEINIISSSLTTYNDSLASYYS